MKCEKVCAINRGSGSAHTHNERMVQIKVFTKVPNLDATVVEED